MAPPVDPTEEEKRVWDRMRDGSLDPEAGANELSGLQKDGIHITSLSIELMALETAAEQRALIDRNADVRGDSDN